MDHTWLTTVGNGWLVDDGYTMAGLMVVHGSSDHEPEPPPNCSA